MIEIKNLTVGTNEKKIIKDINLNISKGEIVGNGSISSILSEPKSEFMKQIKKMRKLKDDRIWNTEKYCFKA
ncbi:hypothetical protein KQI42_15445 [Tissierella sp. MSJ-40]|uniref:Uncharacterized protein n=1 Tax=Tissierella simiarum TaxID=2841534 RepID=A0ABS6E910_9FIRM|nr:hypothetical protein [Tissierella simiarum]MBU5439413.1 hypothetical protein [Tissierella simiarum]